MEKWIEIRNRSSGSARLVRARWCDSFACRLRGLMFRRSLGQEEGLLLVESQESRSGTAIHMLFVFFPIGVMWLDQDFRVVDAVLAKPWHPIYIPAGPAKYILEVNPGVLESVGVGDFLEIKHEALG